MKFRKRITLVRGEQKYVEVTLRDDNGDVQNLTGWSSVAFALAAFSGGAAQLTKSGTSSDPGDFTVDAAGGKVTILLRAAETSAVTADECVGDVRVTFGTGEVLRSEKFMAVMETGVAA